MPSVASTVLFCLRLSARHGLSWAGLRQSGGDAITVSIWGLCFLVTWHGIDAARDVSKEIKNENNKPKAIAYLEIVSGSGERIPATRETDASYSYPDIKIWGMTAVLILLSAVASYLVWDKTKDWGIPSQSEIAQNDEIKNLEQFVIAKNENELRQTFGFPEMMNINITMIAHKVSYIRQVGGRAFDLTPYISGGREMLFNSDVAGNTLSRQGGGFRLDPDPNRVPLIVLPEEYSASLKLLNKYIDSDELPSAIVSQIKEFETAITDNAELLLRVLDETLRDHPDYYINYNDINSLHWHEIDNAYFGRFTMLKPKAQKIRDAIRDFQNVK